LFRWRRFDSSMSPVASFALDFGPAFAHLRTT
jgi:hypothetical protein